MIFVGATSGIVILVIIIMLFLCIRLSGRNKDKQREKEREFADDIIPEVRTDFKSINRNDINKNLDRDNFPNLNHMFQL